MGLILGLCWPNAMQISLSFTNIALNQSAVLVPEEAKSSSILPFWTPVAVPAPLVSYGMYYHSRTPVWTQGGVLVPL